jgi:hypothetical protein
MPNTSWKAAYLAFNQIVVNSLPPIRHLSSCTNHTVENSNTRPPNYYHRRNLRKTTNRPYGGTLLHLDP